MSKGAINPHRQSMYHDLLMEPSTEIADRADGPGPVRVLAFNLGQTPYRILMALIPSQPDMVWLGVAQDHAELLLMCACGVDLLILGALAARPLPAICTHLLSEFPYLRIIVLTPDLADSELYWLGLRKRKARYTSPTALLAGIRSAYALSPTA